MRIICACFVLFFFQYTLSAQTLTRSEVYDKVLGMLVGSAIGDAMGAPTEMWTRPNIQLNYGFVDKLDSMVREPSGEGTWAWNLPAGGTTDDTRWKKLTVEYLLTENKSGDLEAANFAKHIMKEYEKDVKSLKSINSFEPEPYEKAMRRMAWLQEWAVVAKPFVEKKYLAYNDAISRFYGGEMVCAGLLYAPTIGAFYPQNPQKAYEQMYKLSIFDIGYARDLSSMAAAMTAAAMKKGATKETLISLFREIDPQGYFKSRLVGRRAVALLQDARLMVADVQKLKAEDLVDETFPEVKHSKADTLYMKRMYHLFKALDKKNQDLPFHAAEITLQMLTAMLYADFDFEKTIAFLVNFGRDNDTNSAVAGGILGALYGFEKLPTAMKQKVMYINKTELNTDFEALANQMTDKIMSR
jgi:ADP-ribosylglycohydrolase